MLEKSTLSEWKEWNEGKSYLEEASEKIVVDDMINRYFVQAMSFHMWWTKRLEEEHKQELLWLAEMQERLQKISSQKGN